MRKSYGRAIQWSAHFFENSKDTQIPSTQKQNSPFHISLMGRFMLAFSGIALLTVGLSIFIIYMSLQQDLDQSISQRHNQVIHSVRIVAEQTLNALETQGGMDKEVEGLTSISSDSDPNTLSKQLGGIIKDTGAIGGILQTRDGEVMAYAGRPKLVKLLNSTQQSSIIVYRDAPLTLAITPLDEDSGRLIIARPLSAETLLAWSELSGGSIHWIQGNEAHTRTASVAPHIALFASISVFAEETALRRATTHVLWSGCGVVLLVLIASFVYTRSLMKDIQALRIAADNIGKGDFNTRTKVTRGDEIGDVALSIDQMAQRLTDTHNRLTQSIKMASVGRFAGSVAHDFNNLLAVIMSYGHLLRDQLDAAQQETEEIEEILRASERAASLTQQLLAFSRRQVLKTVILDLNDVILQMENMLARLLGERFHLELELAGQPSVCTVVSDAGQMEQVLMNLVVNARDAMPHGGLIKITTYIREESLATGETPKSSVVMEVTDTGTGMSKDTLHKIFDPFFTTKPEGEGTGLGLSSVHGIVHQSNGSLEVSSTLGRGSSFRVVLPKISDEREVGTPISIQKTEPSFGKTLLLVDDDDALLQLLHKTLFRAGYQVITARNGLEAIEAWGNNASEIDMIITDVVMPHMSGLELVEHLREQQSKAQVLFISGYPENRALTEELHQFNHRLLTKPFTPQKLTQVVRQSMRSRPRADA